MRTFALSALIVAAALVPGSIAIGLSERSDQRTDEARLLARVADDEAGTLIAFFDKARAVTLTTGRDPSFVAELRHVSGTKAQRSRARAALTFLATMFPGAIAEASLATAQGRELERIVKGTPVLRTALVRDLTLTPYFGPAMASPPSEVYQAEPYVSTLTKQSVISTSTPVLNSRGRRLGLVHLELSLSTFRAEMVRYAHGARLAVVDTVSGDTVLDTHPVTGQRVPLRRQRDGGSYEIAGHVAAARAMPSLSGNANRWVVVAIAAHPSPGLLQSFGPISWGMLVLAALLSLFAFAGLRASGRELDRQANSDGLTGLPNRRRLMSDLARVAARGEDSLLLLLDLDGFKNYNDSFGHLAGDALLTRLGTALQDAVAPWGRAYRLGGDEFCAIVRGAPREALEAAAAAALTEHGDGFGVTASFGSVSLPDEAHEAEEALLLADKRMYRQKSGGRPTAQGQTQAVLLAALTERHPDLDEHSGGVAELAESIASALGLDGQEIASVRAGAELHDIGKVAVPDAIISKPGPLTDDEWEFIRSHTIIGERILIAAPALAHVAPMVRSSHERWDGGGYPDGLAGQAIPLGARIIAVCDSFDAMVSDRPYAPSLTSDDAIAELQACAGTQFDPNIVDAFVRAWAARWAMPELAAA